MMTTAHHQIDHRIQGDSVMTAMNTGMNVDQTTIVMNVIAVVVENVAKVIDMITIMNIMIDVKIITMYSQIIQS